MPDVTQTRLRDQSRRRLTAPAIIAAVFLGLHVLPLFWRPNPLWGVDFLFYLPAPVQGIFVLLAFLLFILGFRRKFRSTVNVLPLALWGDSRRVWLTRGLIVLVALGAFIFLSSARHFLGDGYLLLRKLGADTFQDQYRAPLTFAFIRALHHAGRAFWETAENTYRIYSYCVRGTLCSPQLSGRLGPWKKQTGDVNRPGRTSYGGIHAAFFSDTWRITHYICPAFSFTCILGVRTLKNHMPLYAPALVLGFLLALHQAFAVFGPSLLFLAYRRWRHRQDAVPSWKNTSGYRRDPFVACR